MVGGGMGFEFARRMREKVRGKYRFSSLIKHKIDKRAKPILSPYLLPPSLEKKWEKLLRNSHRRPDFFFKFFLL